MSGPGPTSVNSRPIPITRPTLYRQDSDNDSVKTLVEDCENAAGIGQPDLSANPGEVTQALKSLVAFGQKQLQSLVVLSGATYKNKDALLTKDALLKAYVVIPRPRKKEPFVVGEGAVESDVTVVTSKSEIVDSPKHIAAPSLKEELKATLSKAKDLLTEFRGSLNGLSSLIFKRVKELFGSDQDGLSLLEKPELVAANSEAADSSETQNLKEEFEAAINKAEKLLTEAKNSSDSSSLSIFKQIKNLFGNKEEKRVKALFESYADELEVIKGLINSSSPSSGFTEEQANKYTNSISKLVMYAAEASNSSLRKVPKLADSRFLHGLISSSCSVTSAGYYYFTGATFATVGFVGAAIFISGFIGFWLYGKYKNKDAAKWKEHIGSLNSHTTQLTLLGNRAMSTIITDLGKQVGESRNLALQTHAQQHEDRKKIEDLEVRLERETRARELAEAREKEARAQAEATQAAMFAEILAIKAAMGLGQLSTSPSQGIVPLAPSASNNSNRRERDLNAAIPHGA